MQQTTNVKDCSKEVWELFEKTGSVAAYLLYNEINRKKAKKKEIRVKK